MSLERAAIVELADLVGKAVQRGAAADPETAAFGPLLAASGAAPDIIACLLDEARRKRPRERRIDGCGFLLGQVLQELRLDASAGDAHARRAIEAARQAVAQGVAKGAVKGGVLVLIGRTFAEAGLDPGADLQAAAAGALAAQVETQPAAPDPRDMANHLRDLAASLDDDPFAIHGDLAATGASFPVEHRCTMAAVLAASDSPAVREAALGFAFAADAGVVAATLAGLACLAPDVPVSSTMVDRLERMRPWLAEGRHAGIDAALTALRSRAAAPVPLPRPEIRSVLASLCDGAGAQSLFVLFRHGQRYMLASVLLKIDGGVADAWVRDDVDAAQFDRLAGQIAAASEAVEVSIGFAERRLAAALAINVQRDAPPPFSLLQVAEAVGVGPLLPQAMSPEALAMTLLADLPATRTADAARRAARQASKRWPREFETVGSWFEANEAVDDLLQPIKSRAKRTDAILQRYLPSRRRQWAERCAWTAAALREAAGGRDGSWIDFALVALDLASEQSLETMPLAVHIARASVDAFAQR